MAQLPVSTAVQNKKVILEEFTGITCTYCPDGHKRANILAAANPGNVFVVNIHTGGYAGNNPDYKTPFGAAIASQSNITGYPAGTVNRTVFPGLSQNSSNPGTAMSRGNWTNAANQVMAQQSYLNVALQATLDTNTRELVVNVEVYYTGASPAATNFLHVALLQDSILGPQTGGSTYYPAMMVNGQYQHNKMLRHLLTGQWGDQITTTSSGTLVSKQYTYTVPTHLPLVTIGTNTSVLLKKLRLVAFVTESTQTVVSGNAGPINLTPLSVEEQPNNFMFNVYPNPSYNSATISLNLEKSEKVNVSVVNMLGAEVYSYDDKLVQGMHYIPLDGSTLSEGIYNVRVEIGEVVMNRKLTLVK